MKEFSTGLNIPFFEKVLWGNTILSYFIAAGIILFFWVVAFVLRRFFLRKFRSNTDELDSAKKQFTIIVIKKFIIPLLYLLPVYAVLNTLNMHPKIYRLIEIVYIVLVIYLFIKVTTATVNFLITVYIEKTRTEEESKRIKPLLSFVNFFIWIIGALLLFSNLGFDVSAIIAGFGIGGIAIALAAQAMLGDLFSYFVIFFDKPFELGDFISFDDKKGNVEKVGIKSTQIRSTKGELLVVSNSNLVNARIHNFGKLEQRRMVISLGVTYTTLYDNLKAIPGLIEEVIKRFEKATFEQSHLIKYGDSSLDFETVYLIDSSDYNEYMDIHQEVLLGIYKAFEEKKIEFAYPTQTVYLNKQ